MQLFADRVAETTTTTGTGSLTLAGALTGYRTFNAAFGVTPGLLPVLIEAVDASGNPTGDWECSLCELTDATTLARRFLVSSSTGSAVSFAAGTKRVYLTQLSVGAPFGISAPSLVYYQTDFLGAASADTGESSYANWDLSLISSGTQAKVAGTASHPGILRLSSSATANSGAYVRTAVESFTLSGGGAFSEFVFLIGTLTNTTIRMGFLDTGTSTDATDGAYLEIPATGAAVGKTANNSTRTTSATIATLSTATWYRGRIIVNFDASAVWFGIYSETGTLLGSVTNTTNIPTASGRETGHGVVATNAGTTAVSLIELDYMSVGILRPLTR